MSSVLFLFQVSVSLLAIALAFSAAWLSRASCCRSRASEREFFELMAARKCLHIQVAENENNSSESSRMGFRFEHIK